MTSFIKLYLSNDTTAGNEALKIANVLRCQGRGFLVVCYPDNPTSWQFSSPDAEPKEINLDRIQHITDIADLIANRKMELDLIILAGIHCYQDFKMEDLKMLSNFGANIILVGRGDNEIIQLLKGEEEINTVDFDAQTPNSNPQDAIINQNNFTPKK